MTTALALLAAGTLTDASDSPIGEYSAVGWTPPASLSFEEWDAVGARLRAVGKGLNFWLGDWLAEGEFRWGERYAQGLELGIAVESLEKYKAVAVRVPRALRRAALSWSHHFAVAYLDEDQRGPLLQLAERFDLHTREFKDICALKPYQRRELLDALAELPDDGTIHVDLQRIVNAIRLKGLSEKPKQLGAASDDAGEDAIEFEPGSDEEEVYSFWHRSGKPVRLKSSAVTVWDGIAVRAAVNEAGDVVLVWEIIP